MAKDKKTTTVPQKNVRLRLAYLHQAATYFHNIAAEQEQIGEADSESVTHPFKDAQTQRLVNQMKGVSRKAVIRLQKDVKRSLCKGCDAILEPSISSATWVQNDSRNGAKPWADVVTIRCTFCGTIKRFPTGTRKHKESSRKGTAPESDSATRTVG